MPLKSASAETRRCPCRETRSVGFSIVMIGTTATSAEADRDGRARGAGAASPFPWTLRGLTPGQHRSAEAYDGQCDRRRAPDPGPLPGFIVEGGLSEPILLRGAAVDPRGLRQRGHAIGEFGVTVLCGVLVEQGRSLVEE
jgi:hypothetical protein